MTSESVRTATVSRRRVLQATAALGALGALGSTRTPATAVPGGAGKTAAVIGTGFGGSVAALRLGQAGFRTTVFERGRRWDIRKDGNTFPSITKLDGRASWFAGQVSLGGPAGIPVAKYPGLLDQIKGNGIDSVYGAGVGGGSLVFGAFTSTPRKQDFEHVFPGGTGYDELKRVYYPRALKMLNASKLPADILAHPNYVGARSWAKTVRRYGAHLRTFEYAVDWDIVRAELAGRATPSFSIGEMGFGANSGAKNSTDHNYLPAAERTGNVTIKPMHEVFEIRPRGNRPGFVVKAREIDYQHRTVRIVTADVDYVFLGAGSFHTTRLLVEARAKGHLPKLSGKIGDGFGANGDFLTARTGLTDDYGPVQGGPGYGRFYDDDFPGGPVSMVYHSTPLPYPTGKLLTTNLIQVFSPERGTIDYNRSTGTAELNYPFAEHTSILDRRGNSFANHFARRAGGVPIVSRLAGFGSASTYHGLGGVVINQAADLNGAVRGYDNLYVVDGAFMPGEVGLVNPSLTIAATAERTMDRFVATH
ncbi:MAG: GMC family oxidoreductase [Gordonia sp.]|uniref:GMC oxidoreductase n=1 Tax=Gordonia sp. (in: high G+C Gram-positive bacteria) TaxID=84139 RepID=UPI001E11D534|nr:GMC oxidoreductase [Gordonia sp. (in: high G+C Gram-positive bacteria)]MCB1293142.1 GMC family oxidoreductase [Gordonia sp. (in: high G+C Gram-positive bacteria)]